MKENIVLIGGSATPKIESMYRAKTGKSVLISLTKRATKMSLPEVLVVDMKGEKKDVSDITLKNILDVKKENKQSLIFLNRRGFSTSIICSSCGNGIKCPKCNINLTYHKAGNLLKCHYCGFKRTLPNICEECGQNSLNFIGIGTQKVQENIEKNLPGISVIRMDQDTTNIKDGHDKILSRFKDEKIDILIGTQMIAKGHHFPDVTLVTVLSADSMINMESFRATETAFSTLVQVIGRAGREENGKAIIQTHNPEHYVIQLAKENDYMKFFNLELDLRKKLNYPPFTDIYVIKVFSKNEYEVQKIAEKLEQSLRLNEKNLYILLEKEEIKKNIRLKKEFKEYKKKNISIKEKIEEQEQENKNKILIYPAQPYNILKINNTYRWRIIIKSRISNSMNFWLEKIVENIRTKIKTKNNTQIYIEVNPSDI